MRLCAPYRAESFSSTVCISFWRFWSCTTLAFSSLRISTNSGPCFNFSSGVWACFGAGVPGGVDTINILLWFLRFLPTRPSGPSGHLPPFFARHGSQTPLPTDLTAQPAHFCHHARNFGCGNGRRGCDGFLWLRFGSRQPSQMVSKLIYVARSSVLAKSLWHVTSMSTLKEFVNRLVSR